MQWKINKDAKLYIGAGPSIELGLMAKYKIDGAENINLYKKDPITDKAAMTQLSMGMASIIGYEFANGIQINAGYRFGVTDVLDAGKDQATNRRQYLLFFKEL